MYFKYKFSILNPHKCIIRTCFAKICLRSKFLFKWKTPAHADKIHLSVRVSPDQFDSQLKFRMDRIAMPFKISYM